ncbi:MAG: phosphoglycolate phosphatase [Pseudomonadales bacterium]|nr:phosphoglycolate phosphatase [Pseudomonadales bacterium]
MLRSLFDGGLPAFIVFDLDGTLVDSVPDLSWAIDQMLLERSLSPAGEQCVRQWVGNGAAKLVHRALAYGYGIQEEGLREPLHKPSEALIRFKHFYGQHYCHQTCLYPCVEEVLAKLCDLAIPMALVTNKPKEYARPILETLKIDAYFEQVLGGECLPKRKPDPLPLLHVLKAYNFEPETCLMVGDSKSDVLAARAAGFKVAALSYGYNHGEPIANMKPDLMMDNLSELFRV